MILFFYGTLMDPDLLRELTGERAAALRLTPGHLPHYKRMRARDGDYPVLVPRIGARAPGLFVEGLDPQSLLWISHFEGPRYLPQRVMARDLAGQRLRPWVFMPVSPAHASDKSWDFKQWQRRQKPRTCRMLRNWWTLEASRGLPLSMDVPWRVRRRLAWMTAERRRQPRPNPHLPQQANVRAIPCSAPS